MPEITGNLAPVEQTTAGTKSVKFTIINAYSVRNIGDAGIVVATINILRSLYPDCSITVMSSSSDDNRPFYSLRNVSSVPAVWQMEGSPLSRYKRGASLLLNALFNRPIPEALSIKDSDMIISAGGGYLYSSRKGPFGVGFLASLFHIWLAKRYGKPVLVGPKSFGPIRSGWDGRVMSAALKNDCWLIAREKISAECLTNLRLTNFELMPDIAFSLQGSAADSDAALFVKGDPKIGITVLDWRFAKAEATESDITNYVESIAAGCKSLKGLLPNAHFFVFPQVAASASLTGDNDEGISRRLVDLIGGDTATLVDIQGYAEPERVIGIYSNMDCFLASRMHSAIFALCGGVPTVAMSYQTKTKGTFELLDLGGYVVEIDALTPDLILQKLTEIVQGSDGEKNRIRQSALEARSTTRSKFSRSVLNQLKDPRSEQVNV